MLATVPTPPGSPEGIAVHGNRVYVAGTATFGTTGKPPSSVVASDHETGYGRMLLSNHAFVTGVLDPGQFTIVDVSWTTRASPLE